MCADLEPSSHGFSSENFPGGFFPAESRWSHAHSPDLCLPVQKFLNSQAVLHQPPGHPLTSCKRRSEETQEELTQFLSADLSATGWTCRGRVKAASSEGVQENDSSD